MNSTKRNIVHHIKDQLKRYPIVAITGPRQAGKTTMLRKQFSDYTYINLENPINRKFALSDPNGFLNTYNEKVILDEVQRVPELFSYLQDMVDTSGIMGDFILSGSQNFNLMENITQSLAGRVAIFNLFPFDFDEMAAYNFDKLSLSEVMTNGFYPAIFDRNINPDQYYSDYIKTYLKRDIQQLVNVQNERKFSNFLKLCATRSGQLLNFNNLARDANISHTTAQNWLTILETSFVLFLLKPYYKNFSKRLMKSPKLYFYDTGLLCHLLDVRKGDFNPQDRVWGNVFENMVVAEKIKRNHHHNQFLEYYFWRNSNGVEIDLLNPTKNGVDIYEIKSSSTIAPRMFKGMEYYSRVSTESIGEKIIYIGGEEGQNWTNYTIKSWRNI